MDGLTLVTSDQKVMDLLAAYPMAFLLLIKKITSPSQPLSQKPQRTLTNTSRSQRDVLNDVKN